MAYRSLTNNESVVVHRTLYDQRGLNDGAAKSVLAMYEGIAQRDGRSVFGVFQESEAARLARTGEEYRTYEKTANGHRTLSDLDAHLGGDGTGFDSGHRTIFSWHELLFGDTSSLPSASRQMRLKFHNSSAYRLELLHQFIVSGEIVDIDCMAEIENVLKIKAETNRF